MAKRAFTQFMRKIIPTPRINVVNAGLFLNVPAKIYADQLTIMDYEVFKKITYDLRLLVAFTPKFKLNFYLVYWIYTKILSKFTPKRRAQVIIHFIDIALDLENSLNSQFAVLSTLNSATISRMKESWKCVPRHMKKKFEKMSQLLSYENNFEVLRNRLLNMKSHCIPYIGLYQKDVISIDAAQSLSKDSLYQAADKEIILRKLWSGIAKFQKYNYDCLKNHIMIQLYLEPEIFTKEMQLEKDNAYYWLNYLLTDYLRLGMQVKHRMLYKKVCS